MSEREPVTIDLGPLEYERVSERLVLVPRSARALAAVGTIATLLLAALSLSPDHLDQPWSGLASAFFLGWAVFLFSRARRRFVEVRSTRREPILSPGWQWALVALLAAASVKGAIYLTVRWATSH